MDRVYQFTVSQKEHNLRLDRYIGEHMPQLTRGAIQRMIAQRDVTYAAEICVRSAQRVKAGAQVKCYVQTPQKKALAPQDIPLEILYEDESVLVLNKPAGMVVHPGAGHEGDTLVNALLYHCGESLRDVGEAQRPSIVHRLDKDTSGVMVIAKTQQAYDKLVKDFASRHITRLYHGFCWGVPDQYDGVWEGDIGRDPRHRKRMAIVKNGRWARTHYRIVTPYQAYASHIVCRLESGRTHQIRVHFHGHGHGLIGDPLYGGTRTRFLKALPEEIARPLISFPRQALHAATLGFEHPVSGEKLFFETSMPKDMQDLQHILATINELSLD